jgi:uroporphyrinogen-III synthase
MASVLLTRPQKDSERLAAELKKRGYECLIAPMLTIMPTHTAMSLSSNGAVMITSGNVFDVIPAYHENIEALLPLPCFCVGSQTAERARSFGFQDVHDAAGDGIGLARLIKHMLTDRAKPILHISGRDIASAAADELGKVGFTVTPWPVYVAEATTEMTSAITDRLVKHAIDGALFFSTRSAMVFSDLVEDAGLQTCCRTITAVGISASVADALRTLPWYSVVVAPQLTEDAVVQRLQETISP